MNQSTKIHPEDKKYHTGVLPSPSEEIYSLIVEYVKEKQKANAPEVLSEFSGQYPQDEIEEAMWQLVNKNNTKLDLDNTLRITYVGE